MITGNGQIVSEMATVYGQSDYIGIHALAAAVNSLTAAGSSRMGVGIQIAYPSRSDKSGIYRMEKVIKKECKERGIELLTSRNYENPLLRIPSVTVEGIAMADEKTTCTGRDIVLSKWIGMDGMLQAARERGDMLKNRFTPAFIRRIMSYEKELFAGSELVIAKDRGVSFARQITGGGIFAALWELSKELHTGFELDMKRISILQETVEVCEYFRLNPYQMTSAGSFLFVTEDGEGLKEAFLREGIMGAVIGRMTDGQGKIIRNGEDIRYLDRPAPDEIWKLHILEE